MLRKGGGGKGEENGRTCEGNVWGEGGEDMQKTGKMIEDISRDRDFNIERCLERFLPQRGARAASFRSIHRLAAPSPLMDWPLHPLLLFK